MRKRIITFAAMSENFEGLTYNSARPDLAIPEYGRNIHNMIDYAKSVADREERNKIAQAIISVMGQLFPHLRDIDDYKHKLWDHLHIIANFELDVDSPYPKPEAETLAQKPERVPYPQGKMKYGHYGSILEELIGKACEYEEGDEKNTLTLMIANLMKRHYLTYNRSSVNDALIKDQLQELSGGKLKLAEDIELVSTSEVLKTTKPVNIRTHKKGAQKRKKKKY